MNIRATVQMLSVKSKLSKGIFRSEGHAQQDECQQHGDAYLVRDVVEHYAQDNDDGGHEQEQCKGHKQGC